MSKIVTVIQARMSSTRLPGKALLPLCGKPMLEYVIDAAPEPCILALPNELDSLQIVRLFHDRVPIFIPDASVQTDDVLGRFAACISERFPEAEYVLRLTGDCPMLKRPYADCFIDMCFANGDPDLYTIYTNRPRDVDGYDMELFSVALLDAANTFAKDPIEREHVTPWMYGRANVVRLTIMNVQPLDALPTKISVDTTEDYQYVRKIMKEEQHALEHEAAAQGAGGDRP